MTINTNPETATTDDSEIKMGNAPADDPEIVAKYSELLGEGEQTSEAPVGDAAKGEAEKPKDQPAAEEKPEPKPEPKDDKAELHLARAQRDVKRLTTENVQIKAFEKAAKDELATIKAAIRKDFIKVAMEETGLTIEQLFQRAEKGTLDRDPLADLPEDMREDILWARKRRQTEAEAEVASKQKQQRTEDLVVIKEFLTENDAKFAFLDTTDDGMGWFLDEVYAEMKANGGKVPDLHEVAEKLEGQSQRGLEALVSVEKTVRKLVANPLVRDLWMKVLGAPNQQKSPTSSTGTASVPKPLNQPEVVSRDPSDAQTENEELARGLAEFRQRRGAA
ncbi:MAG: hypothetical protein QM778_33220 [Myxococcales bacterium]